MQQYGLILADNGSNWYFGGTADDNWPLSLVDELKTVPASAFEAVDESSLMVDPNSGQARQLGASVDCSSGPGYRMVAADGGDVLVLRVVPRLHGRQHLNAPVVGMAETHGDGGYWEVASDGGIFTFGDATFQGSAGALHLNAPVVGMAATPDGDGYWLVASDGGVFNYGDAGFYGSAGSIHLDKPIVGMAATPDGRGYWLVASDGGIFSYGDAEASPAQRGGQPLNSPIVGMAAERVGTGLLAGRLRRGRLQLRRRRLRRLGRWPAPQQAHRGHGRQRVGDGVTGWSPPTGASSITAMPASTARPEASRSTRPSSPWGERSAARGRRRMLGRTLGEERQRSESSSVRR